MFYKITHNQTIVDVNIDTMINYVRYNKYNQSLMICKPTDRDIIGIVSSDSSVIYHLEGCPEIPNTVLGEFIDVQIVEISEEDYIIFKKTLDEQKEIIDPDPYIPPEPEPTQEEIEAEEAYKKSLQFVKDSKIEYMDYLCHQTIVNGINVVLSDGETHHFTLKEEDQINLFGKMKEIEMGATRVSYHANNSDNNDNRCAYYNAEDIQTIFSTGFFHKEFHSTYFESLKYYINSMESLEVISAVYYGMEIPEEYQSEPLKDKYKQLAQMTQVQGQSNENNEENNS